MNNRCKIGEYVLVKRPEREEREKYPNWFQEMDYLHNTIQEIIDVMDEIIVVDYKAHHVHSNWIIRIKDTVVLQTTYLYAIRKVIDFFPPNLVKLENIPCLFGTPRIVKYNLIC
jgi:hypothetical protein